MQGRLRQANLFVTISTECAQSKRPMQFIVDSHMNYQVKEGGPEPLVFSPDVDWKSFADPNIIDAY